MVCRSGDPPLPRNNGKGRRRALSLSLSCVTKYRKEGGDGYRKGDVERGKKRGILSVGLFSPWLFGDRCREMEGISTSISLCGNGGISPGEIARESVCVCQLLLRSLAPQQDKIFRDSKNNLFRTAAGKGGNKDGTGNDTDRDYRDCFLFFLLKFCVASFYSTSNYPKFFVLILANSTFCALF